MKQLYLVLFYISLAFSSTLHSQTAFWTEDFGAGCTHANFTTSNGTWTVNNTVGLNGADANQWYMSGQENGNAAGTCGSGCVGAGDKSLHVSSSPNVLGDNGAAYLNGGFGFFFPETHSRIESPVINCTGQMGITLNFNYIEFGDGANDNAEVWYFDGTSWTMLFDMAKTTCCGGPCNGSTQGQWTAFNIALPASADNNPSVQIGFYWYNNDDGVGTDPSFAVDDVTLTVPGGAAPVPTFTVTSPVCENTSVPLNGSATNSPTSWAWSVSPAGPVIANPSAQNTSITFSPAGTYTVTLSVSNGAGSDSVTQIVLVNAEPTVSVTPNPATICSGSSQNLTASGATTYTWSPGTGLSCTNCAVTTANPTVTTTYTVVGATAGCDDTTTVVVTVTSSTIAGATATSTVVCSGSSTTLTASGGGTYIWASDPSLSCTTCQSPVATPTVNTTYTVTVSNGTCPTATASIAVQVDNPVTPSVTSGTTTICAGQNTTLTASGAATYSWTPGTGLSCTNCANPTASPTVTTTYTVSASSGTVCPAGTASITINVLPATVATASASSSIICNGQSTSLTASGGGTYSWAPATGLSCTACQNPTATPSVTTVYTVTVSNGNCAPATANVTVTVNACIPPVAIFTAAIDTICSGECIDFTSSSTGATTLNWQFNGGAATPSTATTNTVNVCFYTPGTYTAQLVASNANGSDTATQTIFVAPVPVVNVSPGTQGVIYGTQTTLTVTPGGTGYQYSWSGEAINCPTCANVIVTPTQSQWYYSTVTNQYGCSNYDSGYVFVDIQCGEVFVPTAFSPNDDNANDVFMVRANCIKSVLLVIYDRLGEKVFEGTDPKSGWDGTYKGRPLDTGVFYYYGKATLIDGKSYELKGNVTLIR